MCCVPIASRPCSDTFLTVDIPTFVYIFHEMFFTTCLYAFFCFCTPQMSVSVFCNWILITVSHSSASVHCWPCPVLSAKEMRSMKVGSACVRALLRRKRCVRCRLAKGVLFVAMRVCPRRIAIAGHVIKLKLTRRREYISVNGKAAFSIDLHYVIWVSSTCAYYRRKGLQ